MSSSKNFPGDMPPETFREAGHQLIDWITDFFESVYEIPVLPDVQPGDIRKQLPGAPPESGEPWHHIFEDINRIIMPGMTHWNHPRFFAYFSITGSGPGVLGELLAAALNNNAMVWKSGPSSAELEKVVLDWMRQMLGLPEDFWGIVYDTASVSSMHAIAAAREKIGMQIREKGMAGRSDLPRLRLYMSEHAHSSIEKGAITLGIGLEGIRKIPVDHEFRMQPDELAKAIREDRKQGWLPFCVVATVGTTSTTSVDPVEEIADICEQENLWLHVDAAYAGTAAILPEKRYILKGCERANSFVFNPHKWLFVPIDFSAFYIREPEILKQAFSLVPEYLKTSEDHQVENLMDYGIQLGRRFRALKMWFVLRYFGVKGIQERLRYHIQLAQDFAAWIDSHPQLERMAPVPFSTVCFRAKPSKLPTGNSVNQFNQRLLERINQNRNVFLSHTKLGDHYVIRVAFGNLRTRPEDLQILKEMIDTALAELQG